MPLNRAKTLPLRAMTRGLAEMQTSLMAAALPIFDGRVDRFMVFTLLARRTFDGGRPIPVLSIANSLKLPFETTRRHVGALIEAGLCRRERGGVVMNGTLADEPLATLATLAHDCLARFVADLHVAGAVPTFATSTRSYSWQAGWLLAADLMLGVADSNNGTHNDRVNLVLFSTILCGNTRAITNDCGTARRYLTIGDVPSDAMIRPVRIRTLSDRLAMPKATVRRRIDQMIEAGPIRQVGGKGLVVSEDWLATPGAIATSAMTWGNVRRLLAALATQGFPFDAPATAYKVGRPAFVPFD